MLGSPQLKAAPIAMSKSCEAMRLALDGKSARGAHSEIDADLLQRRAHVALMGGYSCAADGPIARGGPFHVDSVVKYLYDQRTLASTIGFDTSTIGGVIDRLETRKLVRRNASSTDRHVRLLTLSQAGRALLDATVPSILRAQEQMLEPLPAPERAEFMRMLRTLVTANNELSRAPSDVG